MTHGQCRALLGFILIFVLVVFNAGCSGGSSGSGGSGPGNTNPTTRDAGELTADAERIGIVGGIVGELMILSGAHKGASRGDIVSYKWKFLQKPVGSQAVLQAPNSKEPYFTADVEGDFTLQLVVSVIAKGIESQPAIALVVAYHQTITLSPQQQNHIDNYPVNCVSCHDEANAKNGVNPTVKSSTHVATSNNCQACHSIFKFVTISYVNHTEVFGGCSDCHNGVLAIGKSPKHVVTEAKCDDCHNTTGFVKLGPDGRYDHTGINKDCDACHNGIVATGKNKIPDHIVTKGDCALCHIPAYFKPAFFDHSSTTTDCAVCHNNAPDAAAIGIPPKSQSPTHPDPSLGQIPDCRMCHSTKGFKPPFVDHTNIKNDNITVTCEYCHNNEAVDLINRPKFSMSFGVSVNHMPIPEDLNIAPPVPQDCDACHSPGTFSTGFFTHLVVDVNGNKVVIAENCATCHDGFISTGLSANHIPIDNTVDCSSCHTYTADPTINPPTFTGASFDHSVTNTAVTTCAACHDGILATGKTKNSAGITIVHIPTVADCSDCHTSSSGNFVDNITFSHQNIKNGCGGCHSGKFTTRVTGKVVGKASAPTPHIPTEQDCYFCHTTDISQPFKPAFITHLGITGNCVSCHDGSYINLNARGKSNAINPIHITTNGVCGACHNTRSFFPAYIDHNSAAITGPGITCVSCHDGVQTVNGKPVIGSPSDIIHNNAATAKKDCSVCHVPGTFATAVFDHAGIVDACATCHDGPARIATAKPADPVHAGTIPDCSTCHNTTTFAGARYDHTGITANCAACHDGVVALGKSTSHVPTTSDCSSCHVTAGFIPATFDHVGIVDNCQGCHDGVFATGKTPTHPLTTGDCGLCHTTAGFTGAVVDHTGVIGDCVRCHDGSIAIGKNPTHLATTLDCVLCHTTATFVGGKWIHGNDVANRCTDCHSTGNGATPIPPPPGHFATTIQCDGCHTTAGWAPASNFVHCPPGTTTPVLKQKSGTRPVINNTCVENVYPGDHRRPLACISCHADNTDVIDYTILRRDPNPLYYGFCASCHAKTFQAETDHINGNNGTVTDNKDCSGGPNGCHQIGNLNGEGF